MSSQNYNIGLQRNAIKFVKNWAASDSIELSLVFPV